MIEVGEWQGIFYTRQSYTRPRKEKTERLIFAIKMPFHPKKYS
jgi:hypothetical protein